MKLDPKHYERADESSRELVLRNSIRWACFSSGFRYVDREFPSPITDKQDSMSEMIRRTRVRLAREKTEDKKVIKFESEGDRLIKRLKK